MKNDSLLCFSVFSEQLCLGQCAYEAWYTPIFETKIMRKKTDFKRCSGSQSKKAEALHVLKIFELRKSVGILLRSGCIITHQCPVLLWETLGPSTGCLQSMCGETVCSDCTYTGSWIWFFSQLHTVSQNLLMTEISWIPRISAKSFCFFYKKMHLTAGYFHRGCSCWLLYITQGITCRKLV